MKRRKITRQQLFSRISIISLFLLIGAAVMMMLSDSAHHETDGGSVRKRLGDE